MNKTNQEIMGNCSDDVSDYDPLRNKPKNFFS